MKHLYSSKTYILSIFLLSIFFISNAQVGIGTIDPKTQLEVDGALSLREGTPLSLNNGLNADISLGTTPYSFYRITGPTDAFSISGFIPETDADGQIVTIVNTTTETLTILNNTGTSARSIFCPGGNNVVLSGIYSTATFQFNTQQNKWYLIGVVDSSNTFESVTLSTDIQINATSWANVPSMSSLTFTAKKPSVLVMFSASGFAYTNSMALVMLRVRNGTTTIGGTNTKMQSYDDVTGTVTPWSCSFSKMLTGLTVGNQYTLTLQGQVDGILGTYNAAIFPSSQSNSHHLTLSVLQ